MANPLAYWASSSVTKEKSFITAAPGRRLPSSSPRSSLSISSGEAKRPFNQDDVRRRRLSLMPPDQPFEADGQLSSIHDSDKTSVIKQKINSKPMKGEGFEEYQTTKKVNLIGLVKE